MKKLKDSEKKANAKWITTVLKDIDKQIQALGNKKLNLIKELEKETDLCSNCYEPSDRKDNNGKIIHQCQSCYDYLDRVD